MAKGLKAPNNITINFAPSPKQYELWKLLQPNFCPHCGGTIGQRQAGLDAKGMPTFEAYCEKCGSTKLPQLILGGGSAGGGKALILNELVATPFGFRKIKDLKVGDIISNPRTGGQQRVIYLHPIETRDYYRVEFVDGTHVDCSGEHLWRMYVSRKKTKRYNPDGTRDDWRIWTTEMMYDFYRKKESGMYKRNNLIIPLCKPIQFTKPITPTTPRPLRPYILGALLGDGCFAKSCIDHGNINFATIDQEIEDMFTKEGYDMTHFYQEAPGKAKSYTISDKQLIEDIKTLKLDGTLSETKFIPEQYKFATIEERKDLLRGLMDTDGYVDDRGHMSYTSVSKQLAEDVAFVVRSLGGKATITEKEAGYKDDEGVFHECQLAYNVWIMTKFDTELVNLPRKKSRARDEFNGGFSELGKRITDIKYIGKREGRCITVDDKSGLFCTNNFTVTHNSYLGSCWVVSSCLRFSGIRAVIGRKTLKSLKGSTFNTVKAVCREWGLKEEENYKINDQIGVMTFWNDSVIILQELADLPSDPQFERFGSSEYTIAFIDEVSEISQKAIEVLFSRLRWKLADTFKTSRMLMTTNPCTTWVRSRFVQDDDGNKVQCSNGEAYVPFSVFDNPDKGFVQTYVAHLNKLTDDAEKERLLYGNWDFVESNENAAYWNFNGSKHLFTNLKQKVYDPLKPIILSFDFNVAPYMSCLAFQMNYHDKKIYILEEILGRPADKENNTPKFANKIREKYLAEGHSGGLIITGDPAGMARSTMTEDGINNYTIILNNLQHPLFRPKTKVLKKQPPQVTRLEFVNAILNGYDDWKVMIDLRCRKLTEDFIYQKKNEDGTKNKEKTTDPELKTKHEKYGHLSDCFDYFLCMFIRESWNRFKSSNSGIATTVGPIYNKFMF